MSGDLFGFGGQQIKPADVHPGAIFSADLKRRYVLARQVGAGERAACFVMLNPSRADEERNDLTAAKCCEFSRLWQCGYVVIVNLVPWIATDPLDLYLVREHDVIADREKNKGFVVQAARAARKSGGPVVCAWGTHGHYLDQDVMVLGWLEQVVIAAQCLGTTAEGYPRHPSRIAYTTPLAPYPTAAHRERLARRVKR